MAHPFRDHPVRTGAAGLAAGLVLGLVGTAFATTGTTSTTTPSSPAASAPTSPAAKPRPRMGMRIGALGTVTAVTPGSSVTVTGPGGASKTIGLNASTKYERDGAAATAGDLATGEHVMIRLVDPSAASPVAQSVVIVDPMLGGTVTSVSGDTILITDPQGFQRTIHTSGTTTYSPNQGAVTNGAHILAFGTIDANKTDLDATRIDVGTGAGPAFGLRPFAGAGLGAGPGTGPKFGIGRHGGRHGAPGGTTTTTTP